MRYFRDIQAGLTALCGIFLVISFFGWSPVNPYLSVAFGSYFALRAAWDSLRDRSIDVNFLMVLAAIGAVAIGNAIDAAALLFLFSLSSTLEAYTMAKTKSAIEGLIRLRPDQALLVTPTGDQHVPVRSLRIGDTIRVNPFDQVPADGRIVSGSSSINQSAMTGESAPVDKSMGDTVLAGTQNLEGMIVVSVTSEVGGTTLDKIVALVQNAQENKASGERISAWFGQRYTFFVVGVFACSWIARSLLHQSDAFYQSLTLLVALSPCALVISTPASTLSALAWAARNGMLIRGGEFIEQMGRIDAAALDKTGTLTLGAPKLVEICVCSHAPVAVGGTSSVCREEEACWRGEGALSDEARAILCAAAGGEQYSNHPIAEAIVRAAHENGIHVPEASEQYTHSGLGVTAVIDGKPVKVGQRRFFEEEGAMLTPDFIEHAKELQAKGMTVAILDYDGKMAALGLRDEPRREVQEALQDMRLLGVQKIAMLTGDNEETALAISSELGISEVYAGLLPDEKTQIIESFVNEGRHVLMVGDGINDAPSLARANVGVAMGGLGSDVALNAADIVLMRDRLDQVPMLIKLGRKTNKIIRVNLMFGAGMILTLTIASMFFKLPLTLAVIGHEGSTVLVILNGIRLLKGP